MQGLARGSVCHLQNHGKEARRETGQSARSVKGLHFRMFWSQGRGQGKTFSSERLPHRWRRCYDLKKSYI